MIRVVVDTNVLVSALISPAGNEALILLAIHQGLVRPLFSEEILNEYAEVLARRKFGFRPSEIAALVSLFRDRGEVFDAEATLHTSPDPGDEKFLACAEAAQAEFIVTGNKRHFPEDRYGVTHIANAGALLELITRAI